MKNYLHFVISFVIGLFVYSVSLPSFLSKQIMKVTVYEIEKGQTSYIGVTENNIRNNSRASIFELTDSICLEGINKKISYLTEARGIHVMSSIYMLCDITYKDGSVQTVSFEEGVSGYIKIGKKLYFHSANLESWLLSCKRNIKGH